jgi:2-polyprenyl-3-methyl-5-hydroxy-6-metoxy-1,4-benzoquinol methylase
MNDLSGDRNIEWAWASRFMPKKKKVLDIGCCGSVLSLLASSLGNSVTGIDLNNNIIFKIDNFKFIQGDFNELIIDDKFNYIILCSTIEHIGLGGRYNSVDYKDGDILTMNKIQNLLKPGATLCLTLPIGQDDTIYPMHRIYGKNRLPTILQGFNILQQEYWGKNNDHIWQNISDEYAFETKGTNKYYSIGLFLLELSKKEKL